MSLSTAADNYESQSDSVPSLPPLYFQGKQQTSSAPSSSELLSIPPELMQRCLVDYCDWGTLARLSAVNSGWASVVPDAATNGGRDAKWELANAMLDGTHGLGRNPEKAIEYLRDLAGSPTYEENNENDNYDDSEQNEVFAPAMRKLAECYLAGCGVEKDDGAGLRWLETAYRRGNDIDAAHELAVIYEYGEHGVDIDIVAAAEWFRVAAEEGHVEGMAEYALCCELGCGREKSDEEALEWYVKAAEAGHVTAKFSVGEAYEEARGVPQSDEEACLWYYKAAVEGDVDSKKALQRLRDIARIVLPGWEGALGA